MKKRALVVVLGELSRSPRMQYHCQSLARSNFDVSVIAQGEAQLDELHHLQVKQLLIRHDIDFRRFLPSILAYVIKPIWQTLLLMFQLCLTPVPHFILVQNPPSIPTLPVLYVYSKLVRSKLIIDWHNYGFSILNLQLGANHPLVRIMRFIEIQFGRLANAGFCVSRAMEHDLKENFKFEYPLEVLYDKPPSRFQPLDLTQKEAFLKYIADDIDIFEEFNLLSNKTALVCSGTSWTEDEDFGLLLDALVKYDYSFDLAESNLPQLICVITGKGPLKEYYSNRIENLRLEHIKFVLPWLKAEDYPQMIGASDLGISLHSSSSGVDLPMKVVDFFGCGLPVLAHKYAAIGELVVENEFGLTFNNSEQLHKHLKQMLSNFDRCDDSSRLNQFSRAIKKKFLKHRWDDNWNQIAKPIFENI